MLIKLIFEKGYKRKVAYINLRKNRTRGVKK